MEYTSAKRKLEVLASISDDELDKLLNLEPIRSRKKSLSSEILHSHSCETPQLSEPYILPLTLPNFNENKMFQNCAQGAFSEIFPRPPKFLDDSGNISVDRTKNENQYNQAINDCLPRDFPESESGQFSSFFTPSSNSLFSLSLDFHHRNDLGLSQRNANNSSCTFNTQTYRNKYSEQNFLSYQNIPNSQNISNAHTLVNNQTFMNGDQNYWNAQSVLSNQNVLCCNQIFINENENPGNDQNALNNQSYLNNQSVQNFQTNFLQNIQSYQNLSSTTQFLDYLNSSTNFDDLKKLQSLPVPNQISLLPKSILELYDTITSSFSEFSFVYALSAQMCQNDLPMECFINLKIALLLSLASTNSNPIPIIAIGLNSSQINLIMNEVGSKVAKRFIATSTGESVAFIRNKWVEAGPALLAKKGVCYFGDYSLLKPAACDRILSEIENEKIILNVKNSDLTFPFETAIWGYWSKRLGKLNTKEERVLNKLLEIFGIPICIDEQQPSSLAHFLLDKSSAQICESQEDQLSIPNDDIKQYIEQISKRKVRMTNAAQTVLQKYFIASRSRGRLTQKGFVMLSRFADSFAKLSGHREILPLDAISAIYLTEQSIQEIFGPGIFPPPKFHSQRNHMAEVDEFMRLFENWLTTYSNLKSAL